MTTELRTPTGRRLLDGEIDFDLVPAFTAVLLAIEHEMYDLASNEGYHSGIQDCRDHDPAHVATLDVDRLATAIDASWAALLAPLGGQSEGLRRIAEKVAAEYEAAPPSKKVGPA